jgi:hypothetical protein
VVKSLSRKARAWMRCLDVVECSMRVWCSAPCLGVPFIAPRDLRLVGAPFSRPWLPSVRGCTRLSDAHQTMNSARESPDWLLSASGGHQTIWWVAPDRPVHHMIVGPGPTWPLSVGATGTTDCLVLRADGPVNYSWRRLKFPRGSSLVDRAPDYPAQRSPVQFLLLNLTLFCSFWLDFIKSLALREIWLVPKTIDYVSRAYLFRLVPYRFGLCPLPNFICFVYLCSFLKLV